MWFRIIPERQRIVMALMTVVTVCLPISVVAQAAKTQTAVEEAVKKFERRAKYLQKNDLDNNYHKIMGLVTPEFREKYRPRAASSMAAYSDADLGFLIQRLALLHERDAISRLQSKGIDLLRAAVSFEGARTTEEFVGLYETIIIGTVVRVEREDLNDGFLSTAVVKVDEWLRGPDTADTIRVRQFGGYLPNGHVGTHSRDMIKAEKEGFSFPKGQNVFLLSQAEYGLQIATRTGRIVDNPLRLYIQNTKLLKIKNGTIVRPSGSLTNIPFPKSVEQLRKAVSNYE